MNTLMYYVNYQEKTALFCGHYVSEPDQVAYPGIKTWLDCFGPAKAHYVRPMTPFYPWRTTRGGTDPSWRLFLLIPGNHQQKPTGGWVAWPMDELKSLSHALPRIK